MDRKYKNILYLYELTRTVVAEAIVAAIQAPAVNLSVKLKLVKLRKGTASREV